MIKQFDVVTNKNNRSGFIPRFLVLQHRFIEAAHTVVVAPLRLDPAFERLNPKLNPEILIMGKKHYCLMYQLAAVPRNSLGEIVASAEEYRDDIIRAYDLIISGI